MKSYSVKFIVTDENSVLLSQKSFCYKTKKSANEKITKLCGKKRVGRVLKKDKNGYLHFQIKTKSFTLIGYVVH